MPIDNKSLTLDSFPLYSAYGTPFWREDMAQDYTVVLYGANFPPVLEPFTPAPLTPYQPPQFNCPYSSLQLQQLLEKLDRLLVLLEKENHAKSKTPKKPRTSKSRRAKV